MRDLLHIDDLIDLLTIQIARIKEFRGAIFNVGGSGYSNLSLVETTKMCGEITGNTVEIRGSMETRPADVKWFVTDNGETESEFNWRPTRSSKTIISDIFNWLLQNESRFKTIFGG